MGLAAMMCCLGVYGLIQNSGISEIFVSIYMILFSVLLFCYELMWWMSVDAINKNLRMNFGFMYGIKGKALYLIFIAFLSGGLKEEVSFVWLPWLTFGGFLGTGVLLLFLHFARPQLLESYKAPTAGFGGQSTNSPV